MNTLLNPEISTSSIPRFHITTSNRQLQSSVRFSSRHGDFRLIAAKSRLTVKAALDSATIEQLGLKESDIINPAISTSYRSSKFPKPNQTVLDAQTKVCTGPTQTKPLNEDQAFRVLDTILKSGMPSLLLLCPFANMS